MEDMKIKDIEENQRPREKMLIEGIENLSNQELLAILINTGSKGFSSIGLAGMILKKAGGIKGLVEMDLNSLQEINGIGPAKATTIFAAMELSKRISKIIGRQKFDIKSPQSISQLFMEELRYKKKEVVKVLLLDTKNNIITDAIVSEGSLNASIVHPREVYIEAIKRSANKIIVVHNHPSGDPNPSSEDINITQRLCESGKILGIELLDHIIIGDGVYCSLRELNYIR
ncbi:MAG: RadC family protein [Proteocatella sp.]